MSSSGQFRTEPQRSGQFGGPLATVFRHQLLQRVARQHRLRVVGQRCVPQLIGRHVPSRHQAVGVKEMTYGIPFVVAGLVFACVGVRQSAVVVGVFWLLHGLYDLVHSQFITNPGVPGWYPVFCFVVDAVIGSYLLWLSRRVPDGNLRLA